MTDKNKAWNPFGMFVLEWGPDGMLYMSVGDHRIDIHGPSNKISGRGNTGLNVIYETHKNALYTGIGLIVGFYILAEILLRQ